MWLPCLFSLRNNLTTPYSSEKIMSKNKDLNPIKIFIISSLYFLTSRLDFVCVCGGVCLFYEASIGIYQFGGKTLVFL